MGTAGRSGTLSDQNHTERVDLADLGKCDVSRIHTDTRDPAHRPARFGIGPIGRFATGNRQSGQESDEDSMLAKLHAASYPGAK